MRNLLAMALVLASSTVSAQDWSDAKKLLRQVTPSSSICKIESAGPKCVYETKNEMLVAKVLPTGRLDIQFLYSKSDPDLSILESVSSEFDITRSDIRDCPEWTSKNAKFGKNSEVTFTCHGSPDEVHGLIYLEIEALNDF